MRLILTLLMLGAILAACSGPGGSGNDPTTPPDADTGDQQAATTPVVSGGDEEEEPTDPGDSSQQTHPPDGEPTPPPDQTDQEASPTEPAPTTQDPTEPVEGAPQGGLLPDHRIISFYGHPSTETMGILGSGSKEDVLARLQTQTAEFTAIDPETPYVMAFEIIATVAQPNPGPEGTYLLYTGDEWIGEYVDFTAQNNMILILDLQIGHNTIENEINRVRHWLAYPHVHVALDPEFATAANDIPRPDRVPGTLIGEISGYQVQTAIDMVAEIVAEHNIPNKILIVHQFEDEMIYEKHVIETKPGVDLVVDMDGFGPPENKIGGYNHFVRDELIQYGGIKLFYEQDVPMIDPVTLLGLTPPPAVIIYQ